MTALSPDLYEDLIGKPYLLHARGPDNLDCVGLLLAICRRRGLAVRELKSISSQVDQIDDEWERVANPVPGDAYWDEYRLLGTHYVSVRVFYDSAGRVERVKTGGFSTSPWWKFW